MCHLLVIQVFNFFKLAQSDVVGIKKQSAEDHVNYYVDENFLVVETSPATGVCHIHFVTFLIDRPVKKDELMGLRKIFGFRMVFNSMTYKPHGFKKGILVIATRNGKIS